MYLWNMYDVGISIYFSGVLEGLRCAWTALGRILCYTLIGKVPQVEIGIMMS